MLDGVLADPPAAERAGLAEDRALGHTVGRLRKGCYRVRFDIRVVAA